MDNSEQEGRTEQFITVGAMSRAAVGVDTANTRHNEKNSNHDDVAIARPLLKDAISEMTPLLRKERDASTYLNSVTQNASP